MLAGMTAAQTPPESQRDAPRVSGVVLEADREATGEFSVRTTGFEVLRYRYDASTSVTREEHASTAASLTAGDRVEVESSAAPGSQIRSASVVRVVEAAPPIHILHTRAAPFRMEDEKLLLARGNLLLSGTVLRVVDGELVLRTRSEGERTLRVRPDARFLEAGARVAAADLKPETRVFIRAGRDLWGETEVYEVAWGQILEPR